MEGIPDLWELNQRFRLVYATVPILSRFGCV
jgi:hypothetical protein